MPRIVLLCHGRTTARPSALPGDEPLKPDEAERIAALLPALASMRHALCSPALAARQTMSALGLAGEADPALADLDLGRWHGRAIADIEASEPQALAAWMAEPGFVGHGGESRTGLMDRVAAWLHPRLTARDDLLAVTHAAVIQAAMLCILDAPPAGFRAIDVAPLHALDIRSDGRRWAIRSFGAP